MFDSKFHGYQSMKLQLSYEITFGYVQKLQIAHLFPLQTIDIVNYNKGNGVRDVLSWTPLPSLIKSILDFVIYLLKTI